MHKRTSRFFGLAAVPALFALVLPGVGMAPARASVLVTATEVGGDVVLSGGGTLDLTDAPYEGQAPASSIIFPSGNAFIIGPVGNIAVQAYRGLTGPASFGGGAFTAASSGTGDRFGVFGSVGVFAVPAGYVSGAPLTGTATYSSATFDSLGLTPGAYVYTLPSGDTITLQIVPTAPPPDDTPPTVTASANRTTLWPPSGKLAPVTVTGQITDESDIESVTFTVEDEYDLVEPSGSLAGGEVTIDEQGNYTFTVYLPASRLGTDKDGRLYTITVTASDAAGNEDNESVEVVVPHDQRKK